MHEHNCVRNNNKKNSFCYGQFVDIALTPNPNQPRIEENNVKRTEKNTFVYENIE